MGDGSNTLAGITHIRETMQSYFHELSVGEMFNTEDGDLCMKLEEQGTMIQFTNYVNLTLRIVGRMDDEELVYNNSYVNIVGYQ